MDTVVMLFIGAIIVVMLYIIVRTRTCKRAQLKKEVHSFVAKRRVQACTRCYDEIIRQMPEPLVEVMLRVVKTLNSGNDTMLSLEEIEYLQNDHILPYLKAWEECNEHCGLFDLEN